MRVVFFDIAARLPMGNNHSTKTLDELLAQSDFVTLHVPETPQTRGMFGAREIAAMHAGRLPAQREPRHGRRHRRARRRR